MKRAVGVLALVAVLAGCEVPAAAPRRTGPPTTSSAAPAAVEWVDRLCNAILEYDSGITKVQIDSSSQDAAVQSLKNALQSMSVRVNEMLDKLKNVGPAPVAGGDEATQGLVVELERLREVVDRSRTLLSGVDTADRTATSTALQNVARDLESVRVPVNPLEGMGARYPELQAAARSADNCTEITRVRASRSAIPPTPSFSDQFPTGSSTPGSTTPPPSGFPESTEPTF
ncbi:hypothetical protein JOF56_001806 [Kibdelosporangium banguiense]|uniref:Lipoprotein n=1 Tax=Kibdelosporangium banguiense TaxID=1365924 RepID=A0ABS4TAH7_9PSEU|nr:hypothetical protein [Kibdelosporangium banguiense]MBP2321421.1 hypothetical protein [Kibdelosporangium banguiense]